MKILFVNGLFPQLSQTFVLDQIAHAVARGHEVEVAATKRLPWPALRARTSLLRALPVRSPQMSRLRRYTSRLRGLGIRARAVREGKVGVWVPVSDRELLLAGALKAVPDVIVANFGTNLPIAVHLRQRYFPSAKLACIFHGFDVSKYPHEHGWGRYQDLAPHLDLALAVNALFSERLRAHAGFRCVETWHLGVDIASLPRRTPHQDNAFSLLFVGRLVEKKGAYTLLRAVSRLSDLPFRLHMIGDGPLRSELIERAHELGIAERVVFYGGRDHEFTLRVMASCDCFVLPSVTAVDGDMEGIPVSLMEAMAIGTPVVSTTHSGIPELITDGVHGRLVPEYDIDGLAEAIREVHSAPARYVAAARARVARDFSMEGQYDLLLARLDGLVSAQKVAYGQGAVGCLASQ